MSLHSRALAGVHWLYAHKATRKLGGVAFYLTEVASDIFTPLLVTILHYRTLSARSHRSLDKIIAEANLEKKMLILTANRHISQKQCLDLIEVTRTMPPTRDLQSGNVFEGSFYRQLAVLRRSENNPDIRTIVKHLSLVEDDPKVLARCLKLGNQLDEETLVLLAMRLGK